MTHCDRVLNMLSDGKPHSYREGYGLGVILHSRVADLRKRGHKIRQWRDGDDYLYQLDVLAKADPPLPSPSRSGSASASPDTLFDLPETPAWA